MSDLIIEPHYAEKIKHLEILCSVSSKVNMLFFTQMDLAREEDKKDNRDRESNLNETRQKVQTLLQGLVEEIAKDFQLNAEG